MNHNKWTKEQAHAVLGTLAVVLALVGLVWYGAIYTEEGGDTELNQEPFLVLGTGKGIELAFDGNLDTAWTTEPGTNYQAMNYITLDFEKLKEIKKVDLILGSGGQPINYLISIQSSKRGVHWTDVIGGLETGLFTEKTEFKIPLVSQKARYLKIGIKPYGVAFQKFRVYEIIVS